MLSKINWDDILTEISNKTGEVRTIGVDFYRNRDGRFDEIIDLWQKANYQPHQVEWINYYPGKDFDNNVVEQFSKEVNLTHIRSWISCVRPGKSAPWHKDIDDNMDEYSKLGPLVRYTCHIDKPHHGQVLLIEKESYYMLEQNTIIKWPDIMSWHGASNCGFSNQYLYHFLGYINA